MSGTAFENDRRPGRGGEHAAADDDQESQGRSGASIADDAAGGHLRRQRDDPSGRRSLTGLEFRRQRSS